MNIVLDMLAASANVTVTTQATPAAPIHNHQEPKSMDHRTFIIQSRNVILGRPDTADKQKALLTAYTGGFDPGKPLGLQVEAARAKANAALNGPVGGLTRAEQRQLDDQRAQVAAQRALEAKRAAATEAARLENEARLTIMVEAKLDEERLASQRANEAQIVAKAVEAAVEPAEKAERFAPPKPQAQAQILAKVEGKRAQEDAAKRVTEAIMAARLLAHKRAQAEMKAEGKLLPSKAKAKVAE